MADRMVFTAPLWLWDARRSDAWTFVTVPAEVSEEIRDLVIGPRRGFGSVRVRASIGTSTWQTSVFPDSTRGAYVLPVKRAVRQAEGLDVGDIAHVTLELVDASAAAAARPSGVPSGQSRARNTQRRGR